MSQYVKITKEGPRVFSLRELRKDNPNVSFPTQPDPALLAAYSVYPLQQAGIPEHDPAVETLGAQVITEVNGGYVLAHEVVPLSAEELLRKDRERTQRRSELYRKDMAEYADPLFFKWQRGEATKQEWLDAIATVEALHE